MNLKPKMTVIAVMSAFAMLPVASFAEEEKVVTDTVAVTGILPSNLEAVPGSFSVVDEEELDVKRPFSVQEALKNVPGVHIVGENTFGLGLNIGIRGLEPRRSSRTLLMEDGMPLFLAPYGDPASHFTTPIERVQRIEVVKGSGQILYGPQTIGGMINFVTKPVPTDGFAGSVTGMAGNNDFVGGHVNIGYGNERGGIMIDALQKKGDGIRDNHDFDVRDLMVKGQLNLTDRQTVIAKVGYYEEDSHISETGLGTLEYAEDKFQAPTGKNDKFELDRKTVQLQHIFAIDERMKLSTNAYYSDTFRTSFRQINDPGEADGAPGYSGLDRCSDVLATEASAAACGGRHRPRSFTFYGVEPRLDFSHNLFGVESDAVIGMRYHEEDQRRRQIRGGDPRFQSLSYAKANERPREEVKIDVEAISYYAQNTFYVGDWSFTPGVRIEDYRVKTHVIRADNTDVSLKLDNKQTEVLPGFGLTWSGIANTTVFAGVHKGFGPPRPSRDLDDISDFVGDGGDTLNKTKFEESVNWEIGVRSNYFKGVSFETTFFHTKIDDIVLGEEGFFGNAGESEHSGIELGGRVDFGTIYNTPHNFYIVGSYTNVFTSKFSKDAEFNGDDVKKGNRLPYAPRDIASISFGYQHPIGLDARIGIDYVSKQYSDRDNTRVEDLTGTEGLIPSYTLLNASVNFKPTGSKATYFLSAHNLADKEYLISRVDGKVAGRERQVFGGIRYDF
ncbi:Fe(3+) dicitrate transport protein FecA [Methylophilaceae bacterium]|nr:Fe(3+) dicitrate transport protein FecA [Methylophilaceae bacterium]